jgi:hypothetical protein
VSSDVLDDFRHRDELRILTRPETQRLFPIHVDWLVAWETPAARVADLQMFIVRNQSAATLLL